MDKINKSKYSNIVYISHPYGGKQENLIRISNIMIVLNKLFPDYLFVSPVHAFNPLYEEVEYQKGLNMTLFLLDELADEMWVFGDYKNSKGCMAEIKYCEEFDINYQIISDVKLQKLVQ